jgi:hypothetical protein
MSEPDTHTCGTNGGDTGYCIRPGTAVPSTVLVADMGDGALLLQGWQVGLSAYVCAADAGPLREALGVAFGSGPANADRSTVVQAQP